MQDDYAIIVGLQNYPDLDNVNGQQPLTGAENDASSFKDWAVSLSGGAVPVGNLKFILSSQYPGPFTTLLDTKPAIFDVVGAFENLRMISAQKQKDGSGVRVGRRLYIYMSGHGIAPTPYGNKNEKEAGLLMANVDRSNLASPLYHIPGSYMANWYCENEFFDEVFLFMDCCRDFTIVPSLNILFPPKGNSDKAKKFYAFATKWSRRSREKIIDGKVQGVFTKTLLLGLAGGAAESDSADATRSVITVASLKSFLYQNMKKFIDPEFINDTDIYEPDIDYSPKAEEGRNFIVQSVPLQTFAVNITAPPGASGEIGIYSNTSKAIIRRIPVSELPKEITLPREEYALVAIINGNITSTPLKVEGIKGLS